MQTRSLVLASLLLPSVACAGLQWEAKEVEFHPSVSDRSAEAEFRFENTGRGVVTITAVEPACDCTTSTLEKTTYRPGEKGRIIAVFSFGQRTGLQKKAIRVSLDGEKEATVLSIIAHIPELLKISPQLVFWQTGEVPQPKTIDLKVVRATPLRVNKVTSSDPTIKVVLETVQEGKSYKVVVTPENTSTPVSALLSIETEIAPKVHQLFSAYAHVKLSKSERPKIWVYKDGEAPTVLGK